MSLQFRAYDHGREEQFRAISSRFYKLTVMLSGTLPQLGNWEGLLPGGASTGKGAPDVHLPLKSEREADGVTAASARMWKLGESELVAYGPNATSSYQGLPTGKLTVVGGIPPVDLPAWIPNQMQLEAFGMAEVELRRDPRQIVAVFQALISAAKPDWAVVASNDRPAAPVPPFADGTPTVGWLTYVSNAYPPIPAVLPEPSVAHNLGSGTLLVAHSSKPDQAAIERLERVLLDAKVLVPAREVRR